MKNLFLDGNNLNGTILPNIRLMVDMEDVKAANNSLSGTIPTKVRRLFKLRELVL